MICIKTFFLTVNRTVAHWMFFLFLLFCVNWCVGKSQYIRSLRNSHLIPKQSHLNYIYSPLGSQFELQFVVLRCLNALSCCHVIGWLDICVTVNSSAGVPNEVPVFLCLIQPNGMMTKGYHNDQGGEKEKTNRIVFKVFFYLGSETKCPVLSLCFTWFQTGHLRSLKKKPQRKNSKQSRKLQTNSSFSPSSLSSSLPTSSSSSSSLVTVL